MSIITVEQLEAYSRTAFDNETAAQATFIVDFINGYICDQTQTNFGSTQQIIRCMADVQGEIMVKQIPVISVDLVHDFHDDVDLDASVWCWDGLDIIS